MAWWCATGCEWRDATRVGRYTPPHHTQRPFPISEQSTPPIHSLPCPPPSSPSPLLSPPPRLPRPTPRPPLLLTTRPGPSPPAPLLLLTTRAPPDLLVLTRIVADCRRHHHLPIISRHEKHIAAMHIKRYGHFLKRRAGGRGRGGGRVMPQLPGVSDGHPSIPKPPQTDRPPQPSNHAHSPTAFGTGVGRTVATSGWPVLPPPPLPPPPPPLSPPPPPDGPSASGRAAAI